MERLVKDGILYDIDFFIFGTCVDCIKGKIHAKVRQGKRIRKEYDLKFIYIDVSRLIMLSAMDGYKYFITFIDDYSRFN